jgi:hypothetical protein
LSQWNTIIFIIVTTSNMLSGADYIWIWTETEIFQEKQKQK